MGTVVEITVAVPTSMLQVSQAWASAYVDEKNDPKRVNLERECRENRRRLSLEGKSHNTQCQIIEKYCPELWETWVRLFGGYSLGM